MGHTTVTVALLSSATVHVILTGFVLQLAKLSLLDSSSRTFSAPINSYAIRALFLLPFGASKALANLLAGVLVRVRDFKNQWGGTSLCLAVGWSALLLAPAFLLVSEARASYAGSWPFAALATGTVLGVEQGLTWSASLLRAMDAAGKERAGLASGWIETAGYSAIAAAAVLITTLETKHVKCAFTDVTRSATCAKVATSCASPSDWTAACTGECTCHGYAAIAATATAVAAAAGLVLVATETLASSRTTKAASPKDDVPLVAMNEAFAASPNADQGDEDELLTSSTSLSALQPSQAFEVSSPSPPTFRATFVDTSIKDVSRMLCCICGFIANLNSGLAWGLLLLWLRDHAGLSATQRNYVAASYSFPKGFMQVFAGALSDRLGRRALVVTGLGASAVALAVLASLARTNEHVPHDLAWQSSLAAALLGLGTALAYPVLAAAVSDRVSNKGAISYAIGTFRFWRDLGYAAGTLVALVADAAGAAVAIGASSAVTLLGALAFGVGYHQL